MRTLSNAIILDGEARPRPGSHLDALIWAAEDPTPRRKRHVTRARLLAATAKVMAANAYARLRVADISAMAGMSVGAFHVYFVDRDEAAREVLSGLLRRLYVADAVDGPCGGQVFTLMIRRHLEALQADAPLVHALNQAVRLDAVLAELSECAVRLWRARLNAALHGSTEAAIELAASPAPDVLDLIIAGMTQRAGTPYLTPEVLSRQASEITRAWIAAQPIPPRLEPVSAGRAQMQWADA